MNYSTDDVQQRVDRMIAERKAALFRDPDRPNPVFTRSRRGRTVPTEVLREQGRTRVARHRVMLDRKRAPTVEQMGRALIAALATMDDINTMTAVELPIFNRMLVDLRDRGFHIEEAKRTLRRLRNRMLDASARQGEPDDSGAEPGSSYPF